MFNICYEFGFYPLWLANCARVPLPFLLLKFEAPVKVRIQSIDCVVTGYLAIYLPG